MKEIKIQIFKTKFNISIIIDSDKKYKVYQKNVENSYFIYYSSVYSLQQGHLNREHFCFFFSLFLLFFSLFWLFF